ncbi:MAG: hypothetical protein GX366_01375 [Epulopiscium sp.]|nr:hypothetical protein [Candidatus Epulonipiscium sp.]
MKYKKSILIFVAIICMGSNVFVYAGQTTPPSIQSESSEDGGSSSSLAELYHKAGLDSPEVIINTLLSLGISKEEIRESAEEGKKIYDILQEKEVPMKKFKSALNKEYKLRIREARKFNVITREEAKILTDLLRERMKNWEV